MNIFAFYAKGALEGEVIPHELENFEISKYKSDNLMHNFGKH